MIVFIKYSLKKFFKIKILNCRFFKRNLNSLELNYEKNLLKIMFYFLYKRYNP